MKEKTVNKTKEPLFHIVKNTDIKSWQAWLIRIGSIVFAFLLSSLIVSLFGKTTPVNVFTSIINGAFGTERRIWLLFQDISLLLLVSLALIPAFKMKFWNLGGNGQVLMGAMMSVVVMMFLGDKVPNAVAIILMVVAAVLAGIIWALIPAVFKAIFNTNESLFTLMLNYIAEGVVAVFITKVAKDGSNTIKPIEVANLPKIAGNAYLLGIIIAALCMVAMYIYMKYSKHGYEIEVVGGSVNTAKYIGINVKKVIIRTLVLSGAVCGLAGLIIGGGINHTIAVNSHNNLGFTAIMSAWLGKFNPFLTFISTFFIVFVNRGMDQVNIDCHFTNYALSDIVIGLIFFFIIACEFFINYKIIPRGKKNTLKVAPKKEENEVKEEVVEEPKPKKKEIIIKEEDYLHKQQIREDSREKYYVSGGTRSFQEVSDQHVLDLRNELREESKKESK